LLDSYSPERSHVGDQVLKSAGTLTTIGTLRNPVAQSVRNMVGHVMLGLKPVQNAFADNMTEVTIGYPGSPLNGPSLHGAGPKPGQRLAPAAGRIAPGSGPRPKFVLMSEPADGVNALTEEFGELLDSRVQPALHAGEYLLIRPDGYVACATRESKEVATYLKQIADPV